MRLKLSRLLHYAVLENKIKLVKILLAVGFNVNAQDSNKKTVLHHVVERNNIRLCKYLLSHGADVKCKDQLGNTPLSCAVNMKHYTIAIMIINNYERIMIPEDVCMVNRFFLDVCNAGFDDMVTKLLDVCGDIILPDMGAEILHLAVYSQNHHIVEAVLPYCRDIDTENTQKQTALHIAAAHNNYRIVELLLRKGANPNIADNNGNLPLHYAAYVGAKLSTTYLLDEGSDITVRNKSNKRPLHICQTWPKMKVIKEHAIKLEILGLYDEKSDHWPPPSVRSSFARTYQFCRREANKMKRDQICLGYKTSVFDIATQSVDRVAFYLRNALFAECLMRKDIRGKYPNYRNIIRAKIKLATKKRDLLEKGRQTLHYIAGGALPLDCIEYLIKYFTDRELGSLTRAFMEPNNTGELRKYRSPKDLFYLLNEHDKLYNNVMHLKN